jgi:hypothetical protein
LRTPERKTSLLTARHYSGFTLSATIFRKSK